MLVASALVQYGARTISGTSVDNMETRPTHILETVIGSGTACVLPLIGKLALPHCLLGSRQWGTYSFSEGTPKINQGGVVNLPISINKCVAASATSLDVYNNYATTAYSFLLGNTLQIYRHNYFNNPGEGKVTIIAICF